MTQRITDLGEIGAVGGALRPLALPLDRDGDLWDLTGYDAPTLVVWEMRTKQAVSLNGTATIETDGDGSVTGQPGGFFVQYAPGVDDPLYALSGAYEGRVWVRPGTGNHEPSGLFRFSIAAGPVGP